MAIKAIAMPPIIKCVPEPRLPIWLMMPSRLRPAKTNHIIIAKKANREPTKPIGLEPRTAPTRTITPITNKTAIIEIWLMGAMLIEIEPFEITDRALESIWPKLALIGKHPLIHGRLLLAMIIKPDIIKISFLLDFMGIL